MLRQINVSHDPVEPFHTYSSEQPAFHSLTATVTVEFDYPSSGVTEDNLAEHLIHDIKQWKGAHKRPHSPLRQLDLDVQRVVDLANG